MQLLPLGDRLLLQRAEEKTVTASGLVIPSNAKEKPQEGSVLAIGPDIKPGTVQVADTILFGKFAGIDISVDGREYLLLRIDEAIAIKRGDTSENGSQTS